MCSGVAAAGGQAGGAGRAITDAGSFGFSRTPWVGRS